MTQIDLSNSKRDEQGTNCGRFSRFLSHKIEISREKNILDTSLGKSKTNHVAAKSNLIILWSELPGLD